MFIRAAARGQVLRSPVNPVHAVRRLHPARDGAVRAPRLRLLRCQYRGQLASPARQPRHHRADRHIRHFPRSRDSPSLPVRAGSALRDIRPAARASASCTSFASSSRISSVCGSAPPVSLQPSKRRRPWCRRIRPLVRRRAPPPFRVPGAAHDRQQPGPRRVAAKRVEEAERAHEGFLDDVVGVARRCRTASARGCTRRRGAATPAAESGGLRAASSRASARL